MSSRPPLPNKIAVHDRRVVLAGGQLAEESVVDCPRRAAPAHLDTCVHCAAYDGMSHDGARARSYVVCQVAETPVAVATTGAAQVAEIMATSVLCVRDDVTLADVRTALVREAARSVPVIDVQRRPIGMISASDLLADRPPGARAADAMTPMAFSIPARATIAQAAALMAFEDVHQLPVVSDDGTVIGLLTALDVLRWEARQSGMLRSSSY